MNPTLFEAMFEINVAIILVTVSVALLVWFQRNLVAASARRMMGMMTRAALDPVMATDGARRTSVGMKGARRRCRASRRVGLCGR